MSCTPFLPYFWDCSLPTNGLAYTCWILRILVCSLCFWNAKSTANVLAIEQRANSVIARQWTGTDPVKVKL